MINNQYILFNSLNKIHQYYTGTWHPVGDKSDSPPKREGGPPIGPRGDNDKGELAGNGPPKLFLGFSESGPEWEFILLCCSEGGIVN